jgi:hypothetical protein
MEVELGVAEPIGIKRGARHHLGADHVTIERVRALPIGYVDHGVI